MYILAIETSCDDTSLALFENDSLLSMETKSQIHAHTLTKGVVPEVAARMHEGMILEVWEQVMQNAGCTMEQVSYIAVTVKPGLIPSLLTGMVFAHTLASIYDIPVIECNHIEGHIFSIFLERKEEEVVFPSICLTASWWHHELYYMKTKWEYRKIGETQDDASWECFDKVAKMLGEGYPGGPIIATLATTYREKYGDTSSHLFPRVYLSKESLDFSFSWLKTAVKIEIEKRKSITGMLKEKDKEEIAFELQEAICDVIVHKLFYAMELYQASTMMVVGGVSANERLREKIFQENSKKGKNYTILFPKKKIYSTDNAAMIGILAYHTIKDKRQSIWKFC